MTLPILTAVTGPGEAALVAGLERSGDPVQVVRRCADLGELLTAAGAGLARAAVVSGDLDRFDREAVRRLSSAGVAVVALVGPGDPAAEDRMRALGVRHVLPAAADADPRVPGLVAEAVLTAVRDLGGAVPPTAELPTSRDHRDPPPPAGRLVAVWGPTGAPGRTTVAVTVAAELAAAGVRTLLVDADTYGASVAQALGLLDEAAGIAAAVRAAQQGVLDVDRLAAGAPVVLPHLRVLTGLPRSQRWAELRPGALEVVWDVARRLVDVVVVDCGFGLDVDEELSFDTVAPQRNGATLAALAAADDVLAVCSGDPVGLARFVRTLPDLRAALPPGVDPRAVVTRVRASAVGAAPERRVPEALARYAGVTDPVLVPDDRDALDAALLAGRTLTEAAPASPARLALAALARELGQDRDAAATPSAGGRLLRFPRRPPRRPPGRPGRVAAPP